VKEFVFKDLLFVNKQFTKEKSGVWNEGLASDVQFPIA
jgi:hypothetical protein